MNEKGGKVAEIFKGFGDLVSSLGTKRAKETLEKQWNEAQEMGGRTNGLTFEQAMKEAQEQQGRYMVDDDFLKEKYTLSDSVEDILKGLK